jgi:hypothetical protein
MDCPDRDDLAVAMASALDVSVIILIKKVSKIFKKFFVMSPLFVNKRPMKFVSAPFSIDYMEIFCDNNLIFMKNSVGVFRMNLTNEPYYDEVFHGFNRITRDVFDDQCRSIFRRNSFDYIFVCFYSELLSKLLRLEDGRYFYTQLWLFSSDGSAELPIEAKIKMWT